MTPDPHLDPNLESWADAELKQLPPIPAPGTLIPSVLEALRARAQRWWMNVWWTWPTPAKAASILAALLMAVILGSGGVLLDQRVTVYSDQVSGYLALPTGVRETLEALWSAVVLVWKVALQPMVLTALAAMAGLYLLCIGLGTAFVRSISNRA